MSSESKLTAFSIEQPEFDEDTYWGRFEAFRKTANPLHAFYRSSTIKKMQDLIKEQKAAEAEAFAKTGKKEIMLTQE